MTPTLLKWTNERVISRIFHLYDSFLCDEDDFSRKKNCQARVFDACSLVSIELQPCVRFETLMGTCVVLISKVARRMFFILENDIKGIWKTDVHIELNKSSCAVCLGLRISKSRVAVTETVPAWMLSLRASKRSYYATRNLLFVS